MRPRLVAAVAAATCAAAIGCKQDSRRTAPAAETTQAAQASPASTTVPAARATTTPASPTDDAAIRRVFADYRTAVEHGDGDRAAGLLDGTTLAFYDRMKAAALTMPAEELREQPIVERLTIVAMRVGKSHAELEATPTPQLIAGAVTRGNGLSSVKGVELTAISVDGNTAVATPRKAGLTLPIQFQFTREPAGWRLDLSALLQTANDMLKIQLRSMSEDDLIRAYLSSIGAPVDDTLWNPPQ
jgi:hypothetical protein